MTAYLDHAATSPLRPEAREAWLRAQELVGNASSVHRPGQKARQVLEESREQVASVVGCDPIEVVFTSGGTESINLALKGLWWSRAEGRTAVVLPDGEHHASMDAVGWLASAENADVRHVGLDQTGHIDADAFAAALRGTGPERTGSGRAALATALMANNEIGTVQDAAGLAAAAAEAETPLHLDAVGAVGVIPVNFAALRAGARGRGGLVALSVSGHKVGAPVGTGALVVARSAALSPLQHGGAQQRGLRSGTQDIAGAAALAAALVAGEAGRVSDMAHIAGLRDRLVAAVMASVPEATLLGDPVDRLPGNAHFVFPEAPGESLLFLLDEKGIAVSTGSACQAGVTEASHVVLALGRPESDARSVLRFSLGRTSTDADVEAVAASIGEVYTRAVASGSHTAKRS